MRKAIPETLAELEREGVLSPEQRATVETRLAQALTPKGEGGDRAGRFISILAALGAVLVGAGILYLVGYNWDELRKGDKLAIVFGTWLAIHYAGFHLAERPGRYPRVGRAVTVIGVLCFGAAIALVAQIYHLTSEYPNTLLVWWSLSIPLLLLTRSRAILLVLIVVFLTWILWHTGKYLENARHDVYQDFVAALALVGAGIGALFSALGSLSGTSRWRSFEPILSGLARPAAIGGAYALSFKDMWWRFERSDADASERVLGLRGLEDGLQLRPFAIFAALVLASVLVLVVALRRGRAARDDRTAVEPLVLLGAGLALAAQLALWPQGIFLQANLQLLLGILALVWFGIRTGRPGDINWGIAVFVVCVATRYVEYLWDKLEGAYAFIGIGLVLLGLGWVLERQRRKWVALSAGRAA